jgi:chloramphenicol 3-O-phosphotransferase
MPIDSTMVKKKKARRTRLVLLRGTVGAGKSTVAEALGKLRTELRIVEIDELKIELHGTTQQCCPSSDFPKAGRRARTYLEQGYDTIAVEAFCEQEHVQLFLKDAGRHVDAPDVLCVWLGCTLDTSLRRKHLALPEARIRIEHARYTKRFRPRGELEIETDHLSPDDVALTLLAAVWQ